MAALRYYDCANLAAQTGITATGIRAGCMCYLGGGKYAVGDEQGIDIMGADATQASQDLTLVTLSGVNGNGDCKALAYNGKGKLLALLDRNIGSPSTLTCLMRQYDVATGTQDWQHSFGAGASGALAYLGRGWVASIQTIAVPADRFYLLEIDGSTVTISVDIAHNATLPASSLFNAMTYDGDFLWSRTGGLITRWEFNQRLPPRIAFPGAVPVFNPLTNPRGMAVTGDGMLAVLSVS